MAMFKVAEVSYIDRGIRAVLLMDDPADLFYLKFIRDAEEFAELFHHKVGIAKKTRDRELERPQRLEEKRIFDSRVLAVFRSLPGSRAKRICETRRFLVEKGEAISYDGVVAAIRNGLDYDRQVKRRRIAELSLQGRSVREISRILGLPPATVDRLKRNARGSPTIDDPRDTSTLPYALPGKSHCGQEEDAP
jgi:hypothetical protein